jgi:hypothetical protein
MNMGNGNGDFDSVLEMVISTMQINAAYFDISVYLHVTHIRAKLNVPQFQCSSGNQIPVVEGGDSEQVKDRSHTLYK